MSQYLNVLLSSSGNNLTGLCVAIIFRKLPARMSQNAELTTRFDLKKVRFGGRIVDHESIHEFKSIDAKMIPTLS